MTDDTDDYDYDDDDLPNTDPSPPPFYRSDVEAAEAYFKLKEIFETYNLPGAFVIVNIRHPLSGYHFPAWCGVNIKPDPRGDELMALEINPELKDDGEFTINRLYDWAEETLYLVREHHAQMLVDHHLTRQKRYRAERLAQIEAKRQKEKKQ